MIELDLNPVVKYHRKKVNLYNRAAERLTRKLKSSDPEDAANIKAEIRARLADVDRHSVMLRLVKEAHRKVQTDRSLKAENSRLARNLRRMTDAMHTIQHLQKQIEVEPHQAKRL